VYKNSHFPWTNKSGRSTITKTARSSVSGVEATFPDEVSRSAFSKSRLSAPHPTDQLGKVAVFVANAFCVVTLSATILGAESLRGAALQLQRFFFSIPRLCVGFERLKQTSHDNCDFVHSALERGFIHFRRFVKAAHLSDKLKGSRPDFLVRYRRFEVEESSYVSAHGDDLR
jgi:hypothetical protein